MPSPWQGLLQGFDRSDPRGSIASLLANRPQGQGGGGLFGGLSGLSGMGGAGGLFGGGASGRPTDFDYTSLFGGSSGSGLGGESTAPPVIPPAATPPATTPPLTGSPAAFPGSMVSGLGPAAPIMGEGPGPYGPDLGEVGGQAWQPPLGTSSNMNPQGPVAGGPPFNWTTANTPLGMPVEGVPANTGDQPLKYPQAPPIPQVNMPLSDAQFAVASGMGNSEGTTITPGVTPFNAPMGAGNSQGTPGLEGLPSYIMQGGNWMANNPAAQGVPFNPAMPDYTPQDYANMETPTNVKFPTGI